MKNRLSALVCCAILASCQTAAPPAPPANTAAAPAEPAPAPRPEPIPVGSPAARAGAQQHLRLAAELLNDGNEERGREEIARALELDPSNRTAACYQRGVTADPVSALGRDSSPYTVRAGDTMGSIAARALGDGCEFYLLARYNQLRVPRQLQAGQTLKIPGKLGLATPAQAEPARPAASEAPKTGPAPTPPASSAEIPANSAFANSGASVRSAEMRAEIDRYTRDAQAAMRKQDLAGAIKAWDKVLELSPGNDFARAKRQEAIELQRRLKDVK